MVAACDVPMAARKLSFAWLSRDFVALNPPCAARSVLHVRRTASGATGMRVRARASMHDCGGVVSVCGSGGRGPPAGLAARARSRLAVCVVCFEWMRSSVYLPGLSFSVPRAQAMGAPSSSNNFSALMCSDCPVQRISPMYSSLINPVVSLQPRWVLLLPVHPFASLVFLVNLLECLLYMKISFLFRVIVPYKDSTCIFSLVTYQ